MTTLTDSLDAVTQYIYDKVVLNAGQGIIKSADNEAVLDPQDVYYGDQEKFPHALSITIEPSNRARTLQGVPYRTDNNFTVYIMCYLVRINQSNALTRKQVQQVSESIETLIHQDPQFKLDTGNEGGLLIHGFCELNESGYVYRNGSMYRTNRITYSGYSKTSLRLP